MWDASSIINLSGGERQTDGPGDYYIAITGRGGQSDLIKETDRAFGCWTELCTGRRRMMDVFEWSRTSP